MNIGKILLITFYLTAVMACSKQQDQQKYASGSLTFRIVHSVDGIAFEKDTMHYVNYSGNRYMISNVQWFLSNLTLVKTDGTRVHCATNDEYLYVDTDLPETNRFKMTNLPIGDYAAIDFTFGLNEASNTSYRFVNPPESFMFWPEYLGGGYHYMKLNGKWINKQGQSAPFNFHLGIGQIFITKSNGLHAYFAFGSSANTHCEGFNPPFQLPEVSSFVQNYFQVTQHLNFSVIPESESIINLEMRLDQWFDGSTHFNHDDWGGSIMQQQQAQDIARENGQKVFRFSLDN